MLRVMKQRQRQLRVLKAREEDAKALKGEHWSVKQVAVQVRLNIQNTVQPFLCSNRDGRRLVSAHTSPYLCVVIIVQ